MSIKIVLDSSADKAELDGVESAYAPLKVCTAERQFIDDGSINIREMVDYLYAYKGRSTSSCPNTEDWLTAFGEGGGDSLHHHFESYFGELQFCPHRQGDLRGGAPRPSRRHH